MPWDLQQLRQHGQWVVKPYCPGAAGGTVTTHLLQDARLHGGKTTRILGYEGTPHSLVAHKGPADDGKRSEML